MFSRVARLAFLLALAVSLVGGDAQAASGQAGFARWRAADGGFGAWQLDPGAVIATGGVLTLAPGASDGEAIGPVVPTARGPREAIPSWNADTPAGSRVEIGLRARVDGEWTAWYELGVWSTELENRHSVRGQRDAVGSVATDTLKLARSGEALQLKLRLVAESDGRPTVRAAAVAFSAPPARPSATSKGDPSRWSRKLELPRCSQMVYPDGGRVWCSPTSTSMILGYWLPDGGPCEPRVRAAVAGVFDPTFRGHGNWPFNTAYAASQGLEGYVARFESLDQAEEWIAAGVPVAFSLAFGPGELSGSPINSTTGHIAVIVGFDAGGNPIVNDPAAPNDASVERVYPRAQLERVWQTASGGTVYLIYPPAWAVPELS
jgi:hypothetical protein